MSKENDLKEKWGKEAIDSLSEIELVVFDEYKKGKLTPSEAIQKIIKILYN